MENRTKKKNYIGFIFIFLCALCFSTQEISGSYLAKMNLNAYQVNGISYLIGALLLLPLAIRELKKAQLKLSRKDIFYFAFLGIIQVSIGMTLLQQALSSNSCSHYMFKCNNNSSICSNFS